MPRKLCSGCDRPIAVCICEHLVSVEAPMKVVILQHPSEQKQALATVPLLQRCLQPVTVLVGEDFTDHPEIEQLFSSDEGAINAETCCVVYPAPDARHWHAQQPANSADKAIQTLIFIDGTWRKAKRIWYANPWLQQLPAAVLDGLEPSAYKIRSSSVEGGVSTLEAVSGALNYLTGSRQYEALLQPFHAMIDLQIKKMGREIFEAHYGKSD